MAANITIRAGNWANFIRWEVERFFRRWRGALRLDEVRRLANATSLDAAVTASLLAAVLAHDLTEIVTALPSG